MSSTVTLAIEAVDSSALPAPALAEVTDLCTEAYEEDFHQYLADIGMGVHLLGRLDGALVAHVMWVTRWLQPEGRLPLRTAYVEAVATRPAFQGRGFATQLLARLAEEIRAFDLGALSPSDERFYARLGWEPWRGPLFIRKEGKFEATPDEAVMILRLPTTPADLDVTRALSAEWRKGEVW